MADRIEDEPALPIETTSTPWAPGLTIRDWFAGQALAGMISTAAEPCLVGLAGADDAAAQGAYRVADAMLSARQKGGA